MGVAPFIEPLLFVWCHRSDWVQTHRGHRAHMFNDVKEVLQNDSPALQPDPLRYVAHRLDAAVQAPASQPGHSTQ